MSSTLIPRHRRCLPPIALRPAHRATPASRHRSHPAAWDTIRWPTDCYPRLTLDFRTNERIINEVVVLSKRLHHKISGFTTHLMKCIQKGPVRGISFKL
ncbi:ribosomal S17-domain-containing protein [Mycena olivaceomarginata]|nr:ribosomal S17-domain-containing protein [Mycena olivaceomarginata]